MANIGSTCCFARSPIHKPVTDTAPKQGVSFKLTPVYGVTIPVIVRLGNLEAKAAIANVRKVVENGKPAIALDLTRAGDRSTFGEVRITKAGVTEPLGVAGGIALYTEIGQRKVDRPDRRQIRRAANGAIKVEYLEKTPTGLVDARRNQRDPALRGEGAGPHMRDRATWIRRAALAALACAGAVSSFASTNGAFVIDAEAQYLLDVNIRQLRLGDGVRGYPTPEGSCLMLGDMATVLDLPLTVDLRRAPPPAGRSARIISSSSTRTPRPSATAPSSEKLDPAAIRETPEGWCVDSTALGRWLGISIKVAPFASVVTLDTPEKLPVELSRERAHARQASQARRASARRPAAGQARLPHVARPGARLHRQRGRDLQRRQRHPRRPPRLDPRRGRNRATVL